MVDVISNGRLDFGVGKGSESHEYKKAGARQEESGGRMYEGVEVLRQAWSDKPVNFSGEFFKYNNVPVLPKPVQRPHPPIWVGCARSEDSFRWAGKNGFNLYDAYRISTATLSYYQGLLKPYREACRGGV